ncbi:restriction endonuclease subunit S [Absicoccus intestinalis]|uniref:Restriction endonuclease subunit S n=1 Tax=Absicoccus intestinalis TaxID=2926319 RepID=A0ABU4WMU3_9FIRM|nr:restriction endonuclease subunit S [Absicoccus sp. CLA-KB-P134]MDX8417564.1 restriction endonuclease subunit S [Absicoccus sp. CLA-KB-P134]
MENILLEECCDILDSRRIPITASKRKKGPYPYYGANGVQDYVADYIFDDELVLLAEDGGNFGSKDRPIAYRVSGKCWVNNHAHVLKPKSGLDVDYLCYSLMFYDTNGLVNGATRQKLTQAMMRKMLIPKRHINEQQTIVRNLNKICQVKWLREQELERLDTLIKARFVEMFGEPIANPMGWTVKRLKDVSVLITNGNTPKGGSKNYVESGITFLRSQNVWRNRIELDDVAFIDAETHESMKKSSLHHDDILITKTGRINTENSSLGRAALFKGADDSANINGHVYLVRLDGSIVPEFVVTILTGEAYRKYIRKVCVGGIDKRQINVDQVEDFPIIIPPYERQKMFAAFAAQVDKSKVAAQIHWMKHGCYLTA